MSESGLLPCPFCGGEAQLEISANVFGERRFRVYCTGGICGARIGLRESMTEAVSAWNRRPDASACCAGSSPCRGAEAPVHANSIALEEADDNGA